MRGLAGVINVAGLDRSVAALRPIGAAFGTSRLGAKRLNRACEYIAWAYPEWDEEQIRACAVDAFRTLLALAAEFAMAPRICVTRPGGQLPPRVELGATQGAIEMLLDGRPCVLITGHCGNWEILGATIASLGVKLGALYRPLKQQPVDDWVRATRSERGLEMIDKFGGAERVLRRTSELGSVGFVADQNAGNKGVFVPFFGRLASSYKSIGLVAMQQRMPLVCGHAVRLGWPEASEVRYRIEVADVIYPEDWDAQPDPLFYLTARYRRAIETMVRRAPEQYLWMHGAWKSRAPHERRGQEMPDELAEKIRALPWMTDGEFERVRERSSMDAAAFRA